MVSCPCALSLAVPSAVSAAISALKKQGLLVRHSQVLERLQDIRQVYFDKTGTLTEPSPRLVATHLFSQQSEEQCLQYAAALERHSSHPLATPFRIYDDGRKVNLSSKPAQQGVRGTIDGDDFTLGTAEFCHCPLEDNLERVGKCVYLCCNDALTAVFVLNNSLRTDAQDTVKTLKAQGLDVEILSGDNNINCAQIAQRLNITFSPNCSPEQKLAQLKSANGSLYVGDGLNDLPALAAADISISTMETVDLVKSKADVLLLSNRLTTIPALFAMARKLDKVTRQNLMWAIAYNFIAIPLAVSGLATPWLAALGMSASSLLVMLNASRLLRT